MKLSGLKPAGTLRFSHYDQVIQAAMDGSGIAIGRSPHNARDLQDGLLVAPFGREAKLRFGTYFVLIARRSADRPVVTKFIAWLREEIRLVETNADRKGVNRRRPVGSAAPSSARGH
ncbi:MAG: LysR substrate-binding domain-containing protein [Gemmatimonadota bacterium]|nr:LysR substrate-binding domain-containing protein [Gemmatimonadota bacterium]